MDHFICMYEDCTKRAVYGVDTINMRCHMHRRSLDMKKRCRSSKCSYPGCTKYPSYGFKGGKRDTCARHRKYDYVLLKYRSIKKKEDVIDE